MIKNILFDMGGVIFDQDTATAVQRFSALGIDTSKYLGQYGQQGFFLDLELGRITAQEYCHKLSKASGRSVDYALAEHCWLGFVKGVDTSKLHDLELLRQQGYRLALLTNTNPFVIGYMDSKRFSSIGLPISHYFDVLCLSYAMHAYKPAPDFYEKALAMGNMKASESIFIDDSAKNIAGAAALGIHTMHVETNAQWMPRLQRLLASGDDA